MPQSLIENLIPGIVFNNPAISLLKDNLYGENNLKISMLRLDEIHPVISGNKLFKLYYFLKEAINSTHKKVITFGGAYSNHLAATAFAFKESNLKCIGFVRGEKPAKLSDTLLFCIKNGMELKFLSRQFYKKINENNFLRGLEKEYGEHILIPEGGFSLKGAEGAALITRYFKEADYTHVCLAIGTATTFAGIMNGSKNDCKTIGFSVLKNMNDIDKRLEELQANTAKEFSFIDDYHFGGYAKRTEALIFFMNSFYDKHRIPLDFVYTGKMMFGVNDLIRKKYFPPGSKILCIHSGGLQGNNSLPEGMLNF